MGYVVVRKPEFVGEHFGDTPRDVANARQKRIRYCGICRDPWWDLNGLFYDGRLSEGEEELRKKITNLKIAFFSAGICEDLDAAQKALSLSNKDRDVNEIIFISIAQPTEEAADSRLGVELLGFDYYIDGYGSVIRLGLFTKPEAFPETTEALNVNGLFDCQEDLGNYLELYMKRCREKNLEIVDLRQMAGASFLVYRQLW